MINEEDLKQIVDAVMARIGSTSKTIEQLAPVESFDASAFIELNGGRKMSASILADAVGKLYLYKYVNDKVSLEGNARREKDTALESSIQQVSTYVDNQVSIEENARKAEDQKTNEKLEQVDYNAMTWVGSNFTTSGETEGIKVVLNKNHPLFPISYAPISFTIPLVRVGANTHGLFSSYDYEELLNFEDEVLNQGDRILALESQNKPATTDNDGYMSSAQVTSLEMLKKAHIPASEFNDGYMTARLCFDIKSCLQGIDAYSRSFIFGEGTLYDYTIGYSNSFKVDKIHIPVHGKEDFYVSASTPALINPEEYAEITHFLKTVEGYDKALQYLPFEIPRIVSGMQIVHKQTDKHGVLVYDNKANKFLYEVTTQTETTRIVEYFDASAKNEVVGSKPIQGRIYICQDKTFVGLSNGLCELNKNGGIVPPQPPVPPTEKIMTGGGANTLYVGIIGGGGADEGYFDVK